MKSPKLLIPVRCTTKKFYLPSAAGCYIHSGDPLYKITAVHDLGAAFIRPVCWWERAWLTVKGLGRSIAERSFPRYVGHRGKFTVAKGFTLGARRSGILGTIMINGAVPGAYVVVSQKSGLSLFTGDIEAPDTVILSAHNNSDRADNISRGTIVKVVVF